MKKLLYIVLMAAGTLVSCNNDLKINAVRAYPDSVTLFPKDSMRIIATVDFSGGEYNEPDLIILKWSSDDENVVTVDSTGYIRCHSTGKADVTVECDGKTAKCAVTVVEDTVKKNDDEAILPE